MLNVSIKVDLIYQFDFNCKTMVNEMPKKTREEILKLLSQNKYQLENRFKVRRMALFGSYARADQKSESDVDILVDIDPSVGLEFVTLAEQIEQLLGLPVELVSRRAIKPKKLKYIEQDLIYV
jgi:predicted nucleotidyltransferase